MLQCERIHFPSFPRFVTVVRLVLAVAEAFRAQDQYDVRFFYSTICLFSIHTESACPVELRKISYFLPLLALLFVHLSVHLGIVHVLIISIYYSRPLFPIISALQKKKH